MELVVLFCVLPVLSAGVFFVPMQNKSMFSQILLFLGIACSAVLLCKNLPAHGFYRMQYSAGFLNPVFYVDKLSALFLILLNVV
ncbi:MAG: hypothetical protein LBH60_08035, partial [Prevotellaceae bacterium]|nr:hypothetical protein [Prevotellaceae bacterium]